MKNLYLNSFVCLLVFTVVSGAIKSDFVDFSSIALSIYISFPKVGEFSR